MAGVASAILPRVSSQHENSSSASTGAAANSVPSVAGVATVRAIEPCGTGSTMQRLALLLLLAAFAWQVVAGLCSAGWIVDRLTFDDTYLLLGVLRGWVAHGFPTFDGLHRTNGFQALWAILLLPIAWLANGDALLLLRGCILLNAAVNAATGAALLQLSPDPRMRLWLAAVWTSYGISARPALCGLENGLLALLVVLVMRTLQATTPALHSMKTHAPKQPPDSTERRKSAQLPDAKTPKPPWRQTLALSAVLAALVWTRLDALLIVAPLCTLLVLQRRIAARAAFGVVLLLGAALLGLALFNYWAGQTPTPISGMVKRLIAARIEPSWSPAVVLDALLDTLGQLFKALAVGVGSVWPPALSAVTRVLVPAVVLLAALRRGVPRIAWNWGVALFVHALGVRLWLGAYHADTLWYYSAQGVAACVALAWAATELTRSWRFAPALAAGTALLKAPLALLSLALPPLVSSTSAAQLAAAAWLRDHVAPEARVASWNAGHVAYFSDRCVVNLDGLVNDRAYYELLAAGRAGAQYLDAVGVDWVVDYASGALDERQPAFGWLDRSRWAEVARIGPAGEAQQIVFSRR